MGKVKTEKVIQVGIPNRFLLVTMSDLEQMSIDTQIVKIIVDNCLKKKSVVVRGKILEQIYSILSVVAKILIAEHDWNVRWITQNQYLQSLEEFDDFGEKLSEAYAKVGCLIITEVTMPVHNEVERLLKDRYLDNKATIIVSSVLTAIPVFRFETVHIEVSYI